MTPFLDSVPASLSQDSGSPTARLTTALSVVIVNYRRWQSTLRLVKQLRHSASFRCHPSSGRSLRPHGRRKLRRLLSEVVVIDNHSPSHAVLQKLRRMAGVSVRRCKRNRGFGRAANEGVRRSRSDWVLLLNPDVSVLDGFLDQVLELAGRVDRDDPRTAIIGLGVRNADGSYQPSTGPLPTFSGTLLRLMLPRGRRKFYLGDVPAGDVDWASGCCLLIRRKAFEDLGGFDPDFFLYYEDVDLCRRAVQRGWRVRFEPDPWIVHHHPIQARNVSARLRLLTRHGLLTFASKHWPGWQMRWLTRIIRAEAWVRRGLAAQRGDKESAALFDQLGALAAEFSDGQFSAAHQRLARVMRRRAQRTQRPTVAHGGA